MNSTLTPPEDESMPATITISPGACEVFRRGLPEIMERTGHTWQQAIEHMALAGFIEFQKQIGDELRKHIALQSAMIDGVVDAVILKLKSEPEISLPELDLIFRAAAAGHAGAQIIMSDFRRFGRSMDN